MFRGNRRTREDDRDSDALGRIYVPMEKINERLAVPFGPTHLTGIAE